MHGLLTQLAGLDTGAEAAVRIIASYDTLIDGRAPIGALTRATASLAHCAAGISRPHHPVIRFAPDGRQLDDAHPDVSRALRWGEGLSVWLERSGPPHPHDDLILERFAIAARLLMTPTERLAPRGLADPALIEVLLSGSHCTEDRARAVRLLGLDPARSIRVVAVASADGLDAAAAARALFAGTAHRLGTARVATIGSLATVVLQPRSGTGAEWAGAPPHAPNVVAGLGGPVLPHSARQSWIQGQLALRFAVAGTTSAVIDYDELGALALLADIPSDRLATNPDVKALALHAETESGRTDLEALEALCRAGSLRQAAAALHMHHSTVATRVARVEQKTGWNLGAPEGTLRASIALQALRFLGRSVSGHDISHGVHGCR